MTRKDYELIAAAIRLANSKVERCLSQYGNDEWRYGASMAQATLESEILDALKAQNPRFDAQRFRQALRADPVA